MKIKFLIPLFLMLSICANAQITITSQVPNTGMLLKEQLWNIILTNNSNDLAEVRLEIDVADILLGQSVLNASSGKLILGKGIRILSSRDIQPIVFNYVSTEFAGNYAPCGNYTVHYRLLIEIPGKGEAPIANEIVKLSVLPLSPPLLSVPTNKSNVDNIYPQFAWTPPTPIEMFNPLIYDLNVVAVEDGQSVLEAIEVNRPVYFNTNIQSPFEKMASSYESLQQGKTYAWQVVAKSNSACASPSEVWTFTIGKDSIKKNIQSAAYTKLSKTNTEITTAKEGVIKMEYINNNDDTKVFCTVYKASDKEKGKRIQFNIAVIKGQNYLSYDINKKEKLEDKTVYELSLKNGRGEEWLMRFIPIYTDSKSK